MAPMAADEDVYFPSLDKCLKEQALLLSWSDVYISLQDSDTVLPPGIQRFLDDSSALQLLKKPINPFSKPSSGTKSRFEHLTAAINIAPDDSATHNITEIKDDALWLSKTAGVDEVVALRVAVLEWQKRPALSLLARSLDAERTTVEDGEETERLNESIFTRTLAGKTTAGEKGDEAKSQNGQRQLQRRARLLVLYHTEKAYILAASRLLFSNRNTSPPRPIGLAVLGSLAAELQSAFLSHKDGSAFIQQSVSGLSAALATADSFGETLEDLGADDNLALRAQLNDLLLLEIISILELIILVADGSDKILSADAVKPFFQLMLDTAFFRPVIASALEGSPTLGTILQLSVSIAGLSLLKLPAVLEFIRPDFDDTAVLKAPETRGYYVCSRDCLKTLQEAFTLFAENECRESAFALLAWVILVSNLHLFAQHSGAIDSDNTGPSSALTTQDHWLTDALNEGFLEIISANSSFAEAIAPLAHTATSVLGVFQQISTFVNALDRYYASERVLRPIGETSQSLLFDLFQNAGPLVQYTSETLGAFLALLGGDRSYWALHDRADAAHNFDTLAEFVADGLDDSFKDYFDEIRYRYPRELGPFHQMLRALLLNAQGTQGRVQELLEFVQHADTFMLRLPVGFSGYREDPSSTELGNDEIPYKLVEALPFFHSQRSGFFASSLAITDGNEDGYDANETCLPAGSIGTLVASGRPPVICFAKPFSPLRYMLGCLCTVTPGNDFVDVSTGTPIPTDDIVDILALLSAALLAAHKAGVDVTILDETYTEAEPGRNLLEIVAELFEAHLVATSAAAEDASLEVLVQCLHFFHAVALVHPGRLWPLLTRSRLLEIDGRGGALAAIVSAVEMVSGRYEFLTASIRLFDALVDAALWSGSAASEEGGRALTRFSERRALRAGGEALPQRMAAVVVTSFARTLLEVFVNARDWRYADSRERSGISSNLAGSFDKVLHYVYGFDDGADPSRKAVVSVLADAADAIAEVMLARGMAHSPSIALVDMLAASVPDIHSPTFVAFGGSVREEVRAAVDLVRTVVSIRVAREVAPSNLEEEIYRASPILARLFVGYEGFKTPIAQLIERLTTATMEAGSSATTSTPSLLGNLSPSSAKDFLVVLGHLDLPYEDVATERDLWRMLTAVVSSKQQWFAISLLTGKIPKDRARLKAAKEPPSRTVSLFSHAINQLSEVSLVEGRPIWQKLPPELAREMLEFVASCQNHWAWAVSELRSHPKFIDAIAKNYIRHLHREPTDPAMSLANEAAIAAKIAQILAMYLYSASQFGDAPAAAAKIVQHLQYFERFGVAAPKYSDSLHKNLKANLEKQHKGLKLENFKHTLAFPTTFGENYFYDVPFASRVLNVRRSAKGKALRGLERHLQEANEDLSYVDAQIALMKGWKLLAIELAKTVDPDTSLSGILIDVVQACLEENATSSVPQAVFEQLRYQRLDLALNLLQKLVTLELKDAEQIDRLKKLFGVAWDTIRTSGFDFDAVFAGDDVPYYRGLLQILFLTLRPLTRATANSKRDPASHPPAQANELIEVLVYIIIKGFKFLTAVLHEDMSRAAPTDFVLLTAMLQVMLKISGIDLLFSQFALHFANNGSSGSATSLFSWAHQFLLSNGNNDDRDPVYGELAILFLLEMSSIPAVAETLAVDGVLSHLASAKLMRLYMRPKGMGPFDNPPRLHSIWSRGILPLCLNLLDAVGAPVAAEVVSFLNGFPTQLARLASDLSNRNSPVGTRPGDSHISLGLAAEAHSLSLLWLVVERYRAAGGAASGTLSTELPRLEWDDKGVRDDVEDFVMGRSTLGPLVVPANEREAELVRVRALASAGKAANRLEERIMIELTAASECLKADVV